MKYLLFLFTLASATLGVLIFIKANEGTYSPIHELIASVFFLTAAVFLVGSVILDSFTVLQKEIKKISTAADQQVLLLKNASKVSMMEENKKSSRNVMDPEFNPDRIEK